MFRFLISTTGNVPRRRIPDGVAEADPFGSRLGHGRVALALVLGLVSLVPGILGAAGAASAQPQSQSQSQSQPTAAVRPAPPATPARTPSASGGTSARTSGPYAGGSLSSGDIQRLIAGAGAGCPLGPCKGCPHHSVTTGACTA